MAVGDYEPVRVSRRIGAPASDIFRVLADPRWHLEINGSGMLRGAVSAVISGAGDVIILASPHSLAGSGPGPSQPMRPRGRTSPKPFGPPVYQFL